MGLYDDDTRAAFSVAAGARITAVHGLEEESEQVTIETDRGTLYVDHTQDCCESVRLVDFDGDVEDLVGKVFVSGEVRECAWSGAPTVEPEWCESETWTFYLIRTTGGDLWMRWLGESNGYYSEEVQVEWSPKAPPAPEPAPKVRDPRPPQQRILDILRDLAEDDVLRVYNIDLDMRDPAPLDGAIADWIRAGYPGTAETLTD